MFGNRWFGMKPKPVVKLQYVTPWKKAVIGLLCLLVFGLACFVAGDVYEHDQRIISYQLELPANTLDEDVVDFEQQYTLTPVNYSVEYTPQPNDWNPEPEALEAELRCLAQNIYFEARSESRKGKIAVGLVTINRVKAKRFPDSICGVVWQKRRNQNEEWVAQFSWTWDGKGDTPREREQWEEAQMVAGAMIAERSLDNFADFTRGSTHYHAEYVDPWWGRSMLAAGYTVQQIDSHLFYTNY